MSRNIVLSFLFIFPYLLFAQLPGHMEDFNDKTLSGWNISEEHKLTYNLIEEDNILKIAYTRTAKSGEWDNFNYSPPGPIAVVDMPLIRVKVRSDINTVLTFKPVYANGNTGWLQHSIPSDNIWHDVIFNLTNHAESNLDMIYMYLDGGSSIPKSGTLYFDSLQIGDTEQKFRIKNFIAAAVDSNLINLNWTTNFPDAVDYFKVYSSDETGFTCDITTFIDTTSNTFYSHDNRSVDKTYFYKIIAVDTSGAESFTSDEASARTYNPGTQQLFEAEHTTFTNAEIMNESSASNGRYLSLGENAKVLWAFNMNLSGWYKIKMRYINQSSSCVIGFTKNGTNWDIGLGWMDSWSEHTRLVKLDKGVNTIELITGQCLTNLDYLYIDTVTVIPHLTPVSNGIYDKYERDIAVKLNAYGRTVNNITAGSHLLNFTQQKYAFEEDAWKLQIDKSSLSELEVGSNEISINYSSGESSIINVNYIKDATPAALTIVAPYVSHGNAVLFMLPTGKTMLVDCGTSTMRDEVVIPLLQNNNITKLDYFILTHYHQDHDSGDRGETIKKMFDIGQFYDYKSFEEGDTLQLERCHMKVLNAYSSGSDENTRSLSFKLEYNGFIYGHGADIYESNQQKILEYFPDDVKAHVYSANHHLHGTVCAEYYRKMDPCIVFNQAQEAIYARSAYTQTYLFDVVEWLKKNSKRYIETLTPLEVGTVVIRANSETDWTYETYINSDALAIPYILQN